MTDNASGTEYKFFVIGQEDWLISNGHLNEYVSKIVEKNCPNQRNPVNTAQGVVVLLLLAVFVIVRLPLTPSEEDRTRAFRVYHTAGEDDHATRL